MLNNWWESQAPNEPRVDKTPPFKSSIINNRNPIPYPVFYKGHRSLSPKWRIMCTVAVWHSRNVSRLETIRQRIYHRVFMVDKSCQGQKKKKRVPLRNMRSATLPMHPPWWEWILNLSVLHIYLPMEQLILFETPYCTWLNQAQICEVWILCLILTMNHECMWPLTCISINPRLYLKCNGCLLFNRIEWTYLVFGFYRR